MVHWQIVDCEFIEKTSVNQNRSCSTKDFQKLSCFSSKVCSKVKPFFFKRGPKTLRKGKVMQFLDHGGQDKFAKSKKVFVYTFLVFSIA